MQLGLRQGFNQEKEGSNPAKSNGCYKIIAMAVAG
jgi:hypothetical protein